MSRYYTLNELFPQASYREWINSAAPRWSSFNPSIAFSPEEGYKGIIRSSNYQMDYDGYYHMTNGEGIIRTRNHLATLDGNLNIVDMDLIDEGGRPPNGYTGQWGGWGPIEFPLVRGMEDARLHWAEGSWWVYGTLREHRYDGNCEIACARLEGNKLVDQFVMKNPEPGRTQKNWTVLSGTGQFIYTVNPPSTIFNGADVTTMYPIDPEFLPTDTRGSSQAIPCGDGWISVTHEVDWSTGRRRYYHRFVRYDQFGFATRWTRPFSIVKPTIEFVAGLVEHQEDYVISLGYEDSRCFLARIPQEEVLSELRN